MSEDTMNRGRGRSARDNGSPPGKPVKRKKSILRSLSLSRRGSKSRASSPDYVTSSDAPPAIPSPNSRVVSTSSIGEEPASGNLQSWNTNSAIQDMDLNASRGQQHHSYSVRDSTSTTHSSKYQNFSRHPRNRSGTESSFDDRQPVYRDTLLPPPPAPPATGDLPQDVSPARSLRQQQSHGAFMRHDSRVGNGWNDSGHTQSALPRPSTAITDSRNGRGREAPNFSSPRSTAYMQTNDNFRPPRSPMVDHWSYRSSRQDEVRASGVSTWSSGLDSGSTKHSSVFTKTSYISDATTENDTDNGKDELTVDDAIDLYYTGFDDDQATPTENPRSARHTQFFAHLTPGNASSQLADAMNDPMGSLAPPRSLRQENHPDSTAIITGAVFKNLDPKPPEQEKPTETHDQYGFRKWSRELTIAEHDAWHDGYASMQSRRNGKWVEMMKGLGLSTREPTTFPPRSVKMQRYIRKGIPPKWRGAAWFFYAGGNEVLQKNPDVYSDLIVAAEKGSLNVGDQESIERDLHRTFPDNIHFKPEQPTNAPEETPLLSALRRVLSAFAIHHPKIGYCQSLNFLAGLLLLFLTEEKAFWMLHIITTKILPGTHETSLEGANVDLWVLMLALKDALPGVWTKVGGENQKTPSKLPPISLCTTSWFMSLFIGTLPVETTLRVWDVLFYDGSVTIFRVALGVFRLGEAEIRAVNDPMETFQVVQTLPRKMLDVGTLLSTSYRKNTVSAPWVEKKRRERKNWYAEERLAEKARKDSKEAASSADRLRVPATPALDDADERVGRPKELSRNKSTGFWAKRSQSMKRAQSTKRSNTVRQV